MFKTVQLLIGGALSLGSGLALAATPAHLYEMNNSLADTMGGPALVDLGGSLTASNYQFAANQGLSLSGVLGSVYTIDAVISLDAVDGWRKLVDFKALVPDDGFYVYYSNLNFYPVIGGTAVVNAGQWAQVTLTRDAAGLTSGYVNGVQQWQFDDSVTQRATFSEPDGVAHFFVDDAATDQLEVSGGKVDYIAIYDSALSATEVGQINSVPEPESYALMLTGLTGLGLWARRQQQRRAR